jgi:hypothetical protein
MCHKGTMPVFSNRSAFENCLRAVEQCDLFFGLITPNYGSGVDTGEPSITHRELQKAIELKKPRWLLAHDHVVFARSLLGYLGYSDPTGRKRLKLSKNNVLDDLRVIDMYETAILSERPLRERQGNWVQKFGTDEDALLFATAQFSRYQEVEAFLNENFSDRASVVAAVENPNRGNGGPK